jgi:uncharacterized protein (TIGR02996 family)
MARRKSAPVPVEHDRPEVRALLDDARANLEDDTPRLVLADWLEEHGDEADRARAEMIRAQVRLHRLGVHEPEWHALSRRQEELTGRHLKGWIGNLRFLDSRPDSSRGLLVLRVKAREFLDEWSRGLAGTESWAWVEELVFMEIRPAQVRDVLESPLFVSPSRLSLSPASLDLTGWPLLFSGDHLDHLRELWLGHAPLPDAAVERLARCRSLANLTRLNLDRTSLGERALGLVAASEHLARLVELHVWTNDIGPGAGRHLASATFAPGLRKLVLTSNQLGPDGARALAGGPFACLEELDVDSNAITDTGLLALCAGRLDRLEVLMAEFNDIGPNGLEGLARCGKLGRLRELFLGRNHLDRGLDVLRADHLPALVVLRLSGNPLGPDGLRGLLRESDPLQLGRLDLEDCRLGPRGAALLAAWPGLAGVRLLDLRNNGLRADGVRALASSKYLGKLHWLLLDSNALDDEAAELLAGAESLPALEQLDLAGTAIGERGGRALLDSKALPARCKISCWDSDRLSPELSLALRRRGD